jgi:multidrug efflux pump subunit AcrA (membrane-fusion protein)
VISIVPTADRQKATVRVRIGLDQLDPRIFPDMGIKVSFREPDGSARAVGGPRVPENAVVKDGDAHFVWLVRDGKVEKHAVKVAGAKDGQVTVLDGLKGGEALVVDAPRRLRDGSAVELKVKEQ